MASIRTFIAGFCTHRSCMAVRGSGLGICQFPAQCVLISAQDKHWLWDTGYSHHFFDATAYGSYRLYPKITPVYFSENQAMAVQLTALNIHPKDLQGVIISHFHADHIAGLKDFLGVPLIASRQGFDKVRHLTGLSAVRQGFLPDLMPKDSQSRLHFVENFRSVALPDELSPFKMGFALEDSQDEVIFVPLDGHATGQIGAFVLTDTGWILLGADAAWSHHNYLGQPPSALANIVMDSPKHYYGTLAKLKALHDKGIAIHLSHEVYGTSVLTHHIDPNL